MAWPERSAALFAFEYVKHARAFSLGMPLGRNRAALRPPPARVPLGHATLAAYGSSFLLIRRPRSSGCRRRNPTSGGRRGSSGVTSSMP